jgi:hypothetical protein
MTSPPPDLASLAARLGALERQNCLLRWFLVGLALLALAANVFWLADRLHPLRGDRPGSKLLQGSRLVLWERGERPTAILDADRQDSVESPQVELVLSERIWGAARGRLRMRTDQTSLELLDDDGKPRVVLGYGKGHSGLTLLDENGRTRAELVNGKDGSALRLLDAKGIPVFSAP